MIPQKIDKQLRFLTQMLIVSAALNVVLITAFSYFLWVAPAIIVEKKAARRLEPVVVKNPSLLQEIQVLRTLSFSQLTSYLVQDQMIEDGYKMKDLALAGLVSWHGFDIERALESDSLQERVLSYSLNGEPSQDLHLFPGLEEEDFAKIEQFLRTEKWPMTPEGLFQLLKRGTVSAEDLSSLQSAFFQTPHFLSVEQLIVIGSKTPIPKEDILQLLVSKDWSSIDKYFQQQQQTKDYTSSKRREFLLQYAVAGSKEAATLLLQLEPYFVRKQLSDDQVEDILSLLTEKNDLNQAYAMDLLTSPRSNKVWEKASWNLYSYRGEVMPQPYDHMKALALFVSQDKASQKENSTLAKTKEGEDKKSLKPVLAIDVSNIDKEKSVKQTVASDEKGALSKTPPLAALPNKVTSKSTVTSSKEKEVPSYKEERYVYYVVQKGDTLWKIAQKFDVSLADIRKMNSMQDNSLSIGKKLKIPRSSQKVVMGRSPHNAKGGI